MRSHDTVSKFAYVGIFTYVSKCVHVNGALVILVTMRRSRTFCQRCPTLTTLFYSWWEDQNTTISGPSSVRQRNAIKMAFCWRVHDGPTLNAGLVASWFSGDPDQYYLETLYFCDLWTYMHMRKTKAPLKTNADVHVQVFTTGILHLKWNTVFRF